MTRREVCVGPYEVGRVIARPFIGEQGNFVRTGDRRDYSRLPKRKMVFSYLSEAGYAVVGVGKIGDIYAISASPNRIIRPITMKTWWPCGNN